VVDGIAPHRPAGVRRKPGVWRNYARAVEDIAAARALHAAPGNSVGYGLRVGYGFAPPSAEGKSWLWPPLFQRLSHLGQQGLTREWLEMEILHAAIDELHVRKTGHEEYRSSG